MVNTETAIVKKVDTYLPVFPGFYGTLFDGESQDEMLQYNLKEDGLTVDEIQRVWDTDLYYKARQEYRIKVAKECVGVVEDWLKQLDMVTEIEYQSIQSPREYNFANDSINVSMQVNPAEVGAYLVKHVQAFTQHIKKQYTSYDGFLSSYSNDAQDWLANETWVDNTHQVGAVLEFVLANEGYTDEQMYDWVIGNCYMDLNVDDVRAVLSKETKEKNDDHSRKN